MKDFRARVGRNSQKVPEVPIWHIVYIYLHVPRQWKTQDQWKVANENMQSCNENIQDYWKVDENVQSCNENQPVEILRINEKQPMKYAELQWKPTNENIKSNEKQLMRSADLQWKIIENP